MKRLFVILSNIFITSFLLWICFSTSYVVIHNSFPAISIFSQNKEVSKDQVKYSLDQLANETDSVIGEQIETIDDKGKVHFSYAIFGSGHIPNGLVKASEEDFYNSGLLSNYYILSGNLTLDRLNHELQSLGFTQTFVSYPNIFLSLFTYMGNGSQLLVLVIFLLTFIALMIIQKTKEMRTVGIRYISGLHLTQIFGNSIISDCGDLLLGIITGVFLGICGVSLFPITPFSIPVIFSASITYNLLLLFLSILFSFLYVLSIKAVHLVSLLKGKLALKQIMGILYLGQLVAFLLIVLTIHRTSIYSTIWQLHQAGDTAWSNQKDWVLLSTNREFGAEARNQDSRKMLEEQWKNFIETGIQNGGMLVQHPLASFDLKGLSSHPLMGKMSINDYNPYANSLYVTPNYLDVQNVELNEEDKKSINSLGEGEFGLLLPEKLKDQEDKLRQIYEDFLAIRNDKGNKIQQAMKARVFYISNNKKRFVYNSTPISYQQFLSDPILIVLKPSSFGKNRNDFFTYPSDYLYFKGLDATKKLVEQGGIKKYISQYDLAYYVYRGMSHNIQVEILTIIAGGFLGIATSILLFNTMTILYFEEFRKTILIKKISGLNFFELHQKFFIWQIVIFILGGAIGLLLTNKLWVVFLTSCVFGLNSILILMHRSRKEDRMASIILKGA